MVGYELLDSSSSHTKQTLGFATDLQVKATLLKERANDPSQGAEANDTGFPKLRASAVGAYVSTGTVLLACLLLLLKMPGACC